MPNLPIPIPDPSLCPLCGQPNTCAMEREKATGQPQGACWCTSARIDPAQLARIPPAARHQACLCPQCAAAVPPVTP